MTENYKGHTLDASAWHIPDASGWRPRLTVSWTENAAERIKHPEFTQVFPTEEEATQKALLFGKRWIDDGKPNLG